MIGRRAAACGMLAGIVSMRLPRAVAAPAMPATDRLAFDVVRHGSVIGCHMLRFEAQADRLHVHIDVTMTVKFGPITLFRYRHQGLEIWRAGAFESLDTVTDNDGEALSVSARRTGSGVDITTRHGTRALPAGALPLTHWNVACMAAPLFNPQDGVMLSESARLQGTDIVVLADGRRVPALHYAMAGTAPIDDWYDTKKTWTALRAKVSDGSVLDYRRTA